MSRNMPYSLTILLIALGMLAVVTCVALDIREEIREASKGFRDLSATVVATYANMAELRKIGKDFARSYEFKEAKVFFKNPDKLRMTGKVGLVRVDYIVNGDMRIIRVPTLHVSKKDSFADDPQKRQTPLDVGVLSDAIWKEYDIEFEGEKVVDGVKQYVLFLKRKGSPRTQRLWIESDTMRMLQREKYDNEGRLKSRLVYVASRKLDNVWVPGKIEAYSPSGKLAGVTEYRNVKVNTNIPDSEFK